jgi:predicted dehydrogenase
LPAWGRSGWDIHAKLLEPMTDLFQVAAVADADASRRLEAVERFDCLAYESFDDLVNDKAVELIVVALPSYVHADCTLKALAAGKHVVCEKPMAASLADADSHGGRGGPARIAPLLSIFQNRRYNPDFRKVQEIIASGRAGAHRADPHHRVPFQPPLGLADAEAVRRRLVEQHRPPFCGHDAATLRASRAGNLSSTWTAP